METWNQIKFFQKHGTWGIRLGEKKRGDKLNYKNTHTQTLVMMW